jgi:hypothetical protein
MTGQGAMSKLAALALGAALLLCFAPAAMASGRAEHATGAPPFTMAEVTFSGSGEYLLHGSYTNGEGTWNGVGTVPFTFESQFHAPVRDGKLQSATGALLGWSASSTEDVDVAVEGAAAHQHCSTVAMPVGGASPPPTLTVGGTVDVQSLTGLSPARSDYIPQCQTTGLPPQVPQPPPWLPAWGLALTWNGALPGSMTAQLPATAATVPYDSAVSYAVHSPPALPACQLPEGAQCTQSLTWTGTVRIEGECAKRGADNPYLPWCLEKEKAAAAAKSYRDLAEFAGNGIKVLCHPRDVQQAKETGAACLGDALLQAHYISEQHANEAIANDPPAPSYRRLVRPRRPHRRKTDVLRRRGLPATARLLDRDERIVALERALAKTQNRTSGALVASKWGPAARQKSAALRFAGGAAKLLRARPHLAHAAAAEVRRKLGRPGHTLALALDGPAARRANQLALAGMLGFAR